LANRHGTAYIVNGSEIDAVLDGISLEFPVTVDDELPVCVVDRDSFSIARAALAFLLLPGES
jgi:hypothetical protein